MLTILPAPSAVRSITGAQACVQKKGPVRLVAITSFQSSAVVWRIGLKTAMPALLMSASMRPKRSTAPNTALLNLIVLRDIANERKHRIRTIKFAGCRGKRDFVSIKDRYEVTGGEKLFSYGQADAASSSGNEGDFACCVCHTR